MKVGDKVRIKLHAREEWVADVANIVDGAVGTLASIYKGMYLVTFNPPLYPTRKRGLYNLPQPVSGMHFDRQDLIAA